MNTTRMHDCVERLRQGDVAGGDELIRATCARLERLARKLLAQFPDIGRWEDAEDVLQNALIRLTRSLQDVRPNSMREFFALGATHLRRELLDMARRYRGPLGIGSNQDSVSGMEPGSGEESSVMELDRWSEFHHAVERLPTAEREVVGLVFYHGWEQKQIAELFNVTERTVRRWWQSACDRLKAQLGRSI